MLLLPNFIQKIVNIDVNNINSVLDEDNECYDWLGRGIHCCETSEVKKCKESWHLPWKTLQYKEYKLS